MVAYLTLDAVNAILGSNWANGDEVLNVTLANNWLATQPLPFFEVVPADIIQAGILLAKGFASGELYQTEPQLTEKSVKADTVAVTKKFANGSHIDTLLMQKIRLLLAPYLIKPRTGWHQVAVIRG